MIQLTRLNGQLLAVNSDLIKFVERSPDTMLTLVNGEKVIVRESMDQVISKIVEFRRVLLAGLPQVTALFATNARPITAIPPRDGQE
jgi:flagellar protein FlbD